MFVLLIKSEGAEVYGGCDDEGSGSSRSSPQGAKEGALPGGGPRASSAGRKRQLPSAALGPQPSHQVATKDLGFLCPPRRSSIQGSQV